MVAASRAGAAKEEARAASQAQTLGASTQRLYERQHLKITESTRPSITNADVIEGPEVIGRGAFNTVYGLKLQASEGKTFDGVFKPINSEENGWVAWATGIPADNPQIAMRNLATRSYAEKLGLDVIPEAHLAVLSTGMSSKKLGLVMERAAGTEAARVEPSRFLRADVIAEVTKLQLLDHLTGQGDRHGGNYFIDTRSSQAAKVTGIDNDQCFGARLTRPESIRHADDKKHFGFNGTGLPPVVDRDMANRITALQPSDIHQMLDGKLTQSEVHAAVARHAGVVQHIANLSAQGLVISPAEWDRSSVQKLLKPDNCYAERDRQRALIWQAQAWVNGKEPQSFAGSAEGLSRTS